jgi:D-3-phosphoglycerate dehydrogenase
MLDAARLSLIKPPAYLINTAPGPLVEERALNPALTERRIAGAGLDVFEEDPVDPDDPILSLETVIVTPHAICWTDECFLGNGRSACESILDVAAGRVPRYVVNRDVLGSRGLADKLAAYGRRLDGG